MLGTARSFTTASAFAMHDGRRAAVIVARASIVIATEVAARAVVVVAGIAAAWRHGAAEVFRAAGAGALLRPANVWAMPLLAARRVEALGLWHPTFQATLRRRSLAMVLRAAMHHGWRALAMIGAATEGLAAVTGATMLHFATEGRASTLVTVVATMHVAIAGAAEVLLAVAVTLTRAAMALRAVAFAAGFRAGTAGITVAVRFWIRTALGLATAGFGAALRAAAIGLIPIGFTTLWLGAFAFGIGAGVFAWIAA